MQRPLFFSRETKEWGPENKKISFSNVSVGKSRLFPENIKKFKFTSGCIHMSFSQAQPQEHAHTGTMYGTVRN